MSDITGPKIPVTGFEIREVGELSHETASDQFKQLIQGCSVANGNIVYLVKGIGVICCSGEYIRLYGIIDIAKITISM